jgi:hypothetical protein
MRWGILLLLVVSGVFSQQGDSLPILLVRYVVEKDSTSGWSLQPLTTFPYLKTRLHPWVMCCSGKYVDIQGAGRAICKLGESTFYVGTMYQDTAGAIYLASQYRRIQDGWDLLYEYTLFVNKFGDIVRVMHKRKNQNQYEDYPW